MANILPFEKQTMVIHALAEGNSIRSIERMTGVNRNTIMSLGLRVGKACEKLMDEKMRGLDSKSIQVDEIWGFIGKKQKNCRRGDSRDLGDVWTFVGIDSETKVVPSYVVGKRDAYHTSRRKIRHEIPRIIRKGAKLVAQVFAGRFKDSIARIQEMMELLDLIARKR